MPDNSGRPTQPGPGQLLFPALEAFIQASGLADRAAGDLKVKLARIRGKGRTRARNLDLPPAPIERQMELVRMRWTGIELPEAVLRELEAIRSLVDERVAELRRSDGARRFAADVLRQMTVPTGTRNNQYFAEPFVLKHSRNGLDWAWCLTPHYELVDRLPPDVDYVVHAHEAARHLLDRLICPADEFARTLNLAWQIARHHSSGDDVLIADVARAYQIAAQKEAFWRSPERRTFEDIPQAAFVANLVQARQQRSLPEDFQFVPATLHQAHGPGARAFHLPVSPDGTETTPHIFLRRKTRS
jgi:hypothetical protein